MWNGKLGQYTLVQTADGSYGVWSEYFDELTHSKHGAKIETQKIYIEGCEVKTKLTLCSQFNVLEVGLGTGIGFYETLNCYQSLECDKAKLYYLALEIEPSFVTQFFPNAELVKTPHYEFFHLTYPNVKLEILIGDARKSLPLFLKDRPHLNFHAIYQDAFSPKKNKDLWTYQWFKLLKSIAHQDVILSTFSTSNRVRKSLLKAGFNVGEGITFNRKKASTKAFLNQSSDATLLEKLERSPVKYLSDDYDYQDSYHNSL